MLFGMPTLVSPLDPDTMATETQSLVNLSEDIAEAAMTIQDFFATNSLPKLSFKAGAPSRFPEVLEHIYKARHRLIDATKTLHNLVLSPAELLKWQTWSVSDKLPILGLPICLPGIRSIQILQLCIGFHTFVVAHHVPLEGSIGYQDLAQSAEVDENHLRRMIRHAMLLRIFHETKDGGVSHSASSMLLATDADIDAYVSIMTEDWFPASAKVVEAHEQFGPSRERFHAPWNVANNVSGEAPFAWWAKHAPNKAEKFGRTMREGEKTEGWSVKHLINGYEWTSLPQGSTIVDVGDSLGQASIALAKAFPHLKFVVRDLPHNTEKGQQLLPEEFKDRINFMGHDFFTEQPVKDADVYFFQFVLLDYSDKDAAKVLQQIAQSMKPGAKIVVRDGVLPEPGSWPLTDEFNIRRLDLLAMIMLNSGQRDYNGWQKVFGMVNPNLKLEHVNRAGRKHQLRYGTRTRRMRNGIEVALSSDR